MVSGPRMPVMSWPERLLWVALLSLMLAPLSVSQDWLLPEAERARIHQPVPTDDPLGDKRRSTSRKAAKKEEEEKAKKRASKLAAEREMIVLRAAGHHPKTSVDALEPNPMQSKRVRGKEGSGSRQAAIKVMRHDTSIQSGQKRNDSFEETTPPPCTAEMDLHCASVRDMGGEYEEMQQCLRKKYDVLGEECRLYTYAASVCDFRAIHEVCPNGLNSGNEAADCVEMVIEQHKRGRTVPKNFLNMSHSQCVETLRRLPRRRTSHNVGDNRGRSSPTSDVRLDSLHAGRESGERRAQEARARELDIGVDATAKTKAVLTEPTLNFGKRYQLEVQQTRDAFEAVDESGFVENSASNDDEMQVRRKWAEALQTRVFTAAQAKEDNDLRKVEHLRILEETRSMIGAQEAQESDVREDVLKDMSDGSEGNDEIKDPSANVENEDVDIASLLQQLKDRRVKKEAEHAAHQATQDWSKSLLDGEPIEDAGEEKPWNRAARVHVDIEGGEADLSSED